MKNHCLLFIFSFLLILFQAHSGFTQKPDNPAIWEEAMQAFERSDSLSMPPSGGIVFTGSSSVRGWRTLEEDFPGKTVLNRGFGGSRIADATFYFDRIITKYQPDQVVLYSGDNDVASGRDADMVFDRFKAFVQNMREKLPEAELLYLSIKPSLARWDMYDEMAEANRKIRRYAFWHRNIKFVDVSSDMLGEDGKPRPELYIGDGLHMTPEGYALWTEILAPYLD